MLTDVLRVDYTVRVLSGWSEMLVRTRLGECDIGWGAFYVLGNRERCDEHPQVCRLTNGVNLTADSVEWTAHSCCVDFSVNYLPWRITLMAEATDKKSFFDALFQALVHDTFVLNFICFAFLFMVIGGHLIWLAERKANSANFPTAYTDGIDDGIWWAMVTATTVGYGDKTPVTPMGRVLAMAFMTVGIALFSVLSGHISASFIESRSAVNAKITSVSDLSGKRVCGYPYVLDELIRGTNFIKKPGVLMQECGDMLKAGEVRYHASHIRMPAHARLCILVLGGVLGAPTCP